jgi:hypothetical protein
MHSACYIVLCISVGILVLINQESIDLVFTSASDNQQVTVTFHFMIDNLYFKLNEKKIIFKIDNTI